MTATATSTAERDVPTTLSRAPLWSHPAVALSLFALPGVGVALAVSPEAFGQNWSTSKYFETSDAVVAVAALGAFAVGSVWISLVARGRSEQRAEPTTTALLRVYRLLFALAVTAYVLWALVGVARGVRPAHLLRVAAGEPFAAFELKLLLAPVAGVTTLTQVVPIASGIAGILAARRELRLIRLSLAVLVFLAVVRAYFISERLAILEAVLPFAIALLLSPRRRRERLSLSMLRPTFPVVFITATAAMFLAFEFNRSWAYYRYFQATTYTDFAIARFTGYYATALNNGALLLDRVPGLAPPIRFSLQWVADFPIVGPLLGLNEGRSGLNDLLDVAGNPEFNTEGGLLALTIDWGFPASIALWALLGAAITYPFVRVQRGDLAYLPLYSALFVGIVEAGRYFYWSTGRAVVPIVAGVLAARYLRRSAEDGTG